MAMKFSRVFMVSLDYDHYDSVYPWPPPDRPLEQLLNGNSRIKTWEPVGFGREGEGPALPLGDMTTFSGTCLIVSGVGQAVLGPLAAGRGEWLPVLGLPDAYRLLNILDLRPVLDEERSSIFRLAPDRIVDISRLMIHRERVGDATIFKLSEFPAGPILVTETVHDRVLEAGLTGFEFRQVWPEPAEHGVRSLQA
jgi:Immunity protein family (Imm11)